MNIKKLESKSVAAVISGVLFLLLFVSRVVADDGKPLIAWQSWTDDLFKRSQAEKKLVLLDLEAIWCHWCHVMDQQTYRDPNVVQLLNDHFVSVKVDQDSRPDLSNRYSDYGWPATIFFSPSGKELAKRAGFIEPSEMKELLAKLVKDPNTPEETEEHVKEFSADGVLPKELREKLVSKHYASLDLELGGLKISQKYLDGDAVEYALRRAAEGGEKDATFVQLTLDNNIKLLDPVWGGAYQYSTHRDWVRPHYEKIMSSQAKNVRLYSLGSMFTGEKEYADAAKNVVGYLTTFLLSPEGVFYTSQDADYIKGTHSDEFFKLDDKGRRKMGMPAIDKNNYSRENGLAIASLVQYYAATGDENVLATAKKAAEWIRLHREISGGGYRHAEVDKGGPYLGDTLRMGEALIALYSVTGERNYLTQAEEAVRFIDANFVESNAAGRIPGFISAKQEPSLPLPTVRHNDENIAVVRFANLVYRYLGKNEVKAIAEHGMKFLSTPAIALNYITNIGIVIADDELKVDPLHITVVGRKDDTAAQALFTGALRFPSAYKRTEWWDKREGPLPNPDVQYPELPKAAAFICTHKRCSLPIYKPEDIAKTIAKFAKQGNK